MTEAARRGDDDDGTVSLTPHARPPCTATRPHTIPLARLHTAPPRPHAITHAYPPTPCPTLSTHRPSPYAHLCIHALYIRLPTHTPAFTAPPASNDDDAHSSPSEDSQHPGPAYRHQSSEGLFPLLYNSSVPTPTRPASFYSFHSHLQCCDDDDCPLQSQQIDANTRDDDQPKGGSWSCFVAHLFYA